MNKNTIRGISMTHIYESVTLLFLCTVNFTEHTTLRLVHIQQFKNHNIYDANSIPIHHHPTGYQGF